MKIVLASDNHGNVNAIRKIVIDNPNADYYWHLGDSCVEDIYTIRPFISVRGNNDYDPSLPNQRIMELEGHRFLLVHGHRHLTWDLEFLHQYAKGLNCDVVLYGHTHIYDDREVDGIRFINPGSCSHNRDGQNPTYAILDIKHGSIKVSKRFVDHKENV